MERTKFSPAEAPVRLSKPQPFCDVQIAIPAAPRGISNLSIIPLPKVMERFINQRSFLETLRGRRGENTSRMAINMKRERKKAILTVLTEYQKVISLPCVSLNVPEPSSWPKEGQNYGRNWIWTFPNISLPRPFAGNFGPEHIQAGLSLLPIHCLQ